MKKVPRKNEKADKAKEMYQSGMSMVDIAAKLNVPDGTVRRWKHTYKWDNENEHKCSERSEKKKGKSERSDTMEKASKHTMKNNELTEKEKLFCLYYIKTFNATQSYMKAFQPKNYNVANAEGYKMLVRPCVREEIEYLKDIKRKQIMVGETDMVDLHMRIAFADIGDYLTFNEEEQEVIGAFGPIQIERDGEKETLKRKVNVVHVKDSMLTDTQVIQEVKQGKQGFSLKFADRHKSMEWLERYFNMNPESQHKMEYDKRKLELELLKLEMQNKADTETEETSRVTDNFLEALNGTATEVWGDDKE